MRRNDDTEEGMMLTEVLIGLAILSLVSLSMFRVFAGTTGAMRVAQETRTRLDIAQTLLARVSQPNQARAGILTGEADNFRWKIVLQPDDAQQVGVGASVGLSVRIHVGDLEGSPLLSSAVIGVGQ
jgi:type II secretory pathway component PulJ